MNPIISVENLSKKYRIGAKVPYKTFRETLMNAITSPAKLFKRNGSGEDNTIWALKDVSFEVQQGEILGIIGRNGAGKTTLLKILSRVTEPTEGEVRIRGRVGSLLEVGTGFHPELTGRENIFLNGAILGMRKEEIKKKFDEIVAFAEIEKFLDTPVKRYSSGMYVRLAFAVAAHLEPEILLVDEVLAVGDAQFQKKCLGKMGDIARGGRTVLFVSHNMGAINSLCTRAICLDSGKITKEGHVAQVIVNYLRNLEFEGNDKNISDADRVVKSDYLRITRVSFLNSKGEKTGALYFKEPFKIKLIFDVLQPVEKVRLGLGINTPDGIRISTTHHTDGGLKPLDLKKGCYCITLQIQNPLVPGNYIICVGAHDLKAGRGLDFVPNAATFTIMDFSEQGTNTHDSYNVGLTSLQAQWTEVTYYDPKKSCLEMMN